MLLAVGAVCIGFGAAHRCMSSDVVAVTYCSLPATWQKQLQQFAWISGNADIRQSCMEQPVTVTALRSFELGNATAAWAKTSPRAGSSSKQEAQGAHCATHQPTGITSLVPQSE
jgi:hypothetical protein